MVQESDPNQLLHKYKNSLPRGFISKVIVPNLIEAEVF
jgi:hypothetical protein